ncbi:MAG: pyrroline-5-carboxylate reductase [Planctomycetes bacterium]|nr:pyrroline-5-carboxylate reductase [Planctomycetota bacterium]
MIERKIGFVGAGIMGEALMRGMLEAKVVEPDGVFAADPSPERRKVFAEKLGGNVFSENVDVARRCGVVILAVKPGVVPAVAGDLAGVLTEDHLIVSIAAGVRLERLEALFGTKRIVRVMPNTPALVGAGAAAYCLGAGATEGDGAVVEEMLNSVGICVRVEQRHMDAVTGLSGSGPAYIYMVVEALSDGGVEMGLPREIATRLAAQTVLGAAKMALATGKDPGELKGQVTTPGGTTIEGIHALEVAGLRRALIDAVVAATEKSRRLSDRT